MPAAAIVPAAVEGMKVSELKEALTERGLSVKGVKAELAARLSAALEGDAAGEHKAVEYDANSPNHEEPQAPTSDPTPPTEASAPSVVDNPPSVVEEAVSPPLPPSTSEVPPQPVGGAPRDMPPADAPRTEEAAAVEASTATLPGDDSPTEAPPVPQPPMDEALPAEEAEPTRDGADAEAPSGVENYSVSPHANDATPDAENGVALLSPGSNRSIGALDSLRAEVGHLRRTNVELTSLVQQWYGAVQTLQQRTTPAPMHGYPAHGYPPFAAPAYSAAGYGAAGYPGYVQASPQPTSAWSEHFTPEGHVYYYNAQTGASSWEKPADYHAKRSGGGIGGGTGGKQKGPPGANLFVVRKMRRGEYDDFNDQQLQEAFERFGQLMRAEITVDKETGLSKGFGFVSYSTPEAADAAMAAMNGAMIGGRQIRIEKTSEDGR